MPRAYYLRSDQGNAGNLMFGETPGTVWAIDADMQSHIQDEAMKDAYLAAFESIMHEIVHKEHMLLHYQAIATLFFHPVAGLDGLLNCSLDQTSPWADLTDPQQAAIAAVLQLIRIRVVADTSGYIMARTGQVPPPSDSDEKQWRHWIALATPRALHDIIEFIEVHTGERD